MPYISQNNFKYGLDGRRSELSSVPGTLIDATDGHVTQGGSFEKRKAFIQLNSTARPANTYGLEVTSTGLVVFGSFAPTGGNGVGTAVAGTTLYNFSAYANVYYQQLVHPSSLFGNNAPPAMTALLCSTSFGGKTWAAAKFADGYVYLFYDGVPIPGSYNGLVLTGVTSLQYIATQLATFIATITGFSVGAVTNSGGNYYFDMWSTSGLAYGLTVQTAASNTGSGVITNNNISTYVAGVIGQAATSKFQIIGGSFYNGTGTSGITSIQIYYGGVWTEILGVATYFKASDTTASFANNIAAQIATYTTTINVTALTNNDTITLYFPVSLGTTPNGSNIRVTSVGDCCLDNTVFAFGANATLTSGTTCTSVQLPKQINIIGPVNYSGGGSYTLNGLTIGKNYVWMQGANDTNCVNGTQTLTNSGYFLAQATSVTLHGIASASVTAAVLLCVEILGSTVTSGVSISAWLTAIAMTIRAYCVANGLNFTAFASGTNLFVSRLSIDTSLSFGNTALIATGVNAVIIADGSGLNTLSDTPMTLLISPQPVVLVPAIVNAQYGTAPVQQVVTASVLGGTAPYQFSWSLQSQTTVPLAAININIPNNPLQAYQVTMTGSLSQNLNTGGATATSTYICTVVDSLGLQAFAKVVVSLFT